METLPIEVARTLAIMDAFAETAPGVLTYELSAIPIHGG
jgi:hypothetical protein